ncbi:MAG: hypothetical protein IJR69_11170 [Bacteroidaceae bacterium]|nr:hypothetical protein [Bacteroidaceae bacterium]
MKSFLQILAVCLLNITFSNASELTNLKVNRMQNPIGIVRTGQFSWQIESEENDVRQLAYHIKVASTPEGLQGGPTMMWDSERRESADMVQVFYQGRRFPYESTIYWQLEVWLSNDEHLQSPVLEIQTGRKGTEWNANSVTKADTQHDYFYYLRWLHSLQMKQADSGELFLPVPDDTLAIPVDRVAGVLYSLYKDEGDVKALYDYYYMVKRWMSFQCQKDSTISSQLITIMNEMAQRINLQADVFELQRLHGDSTLYEPYWLYADEPAWCGGAIRQTTSSIAYNRVEITIPSLQESDKGAAAHECPYGFIHSKWSKEEEGNISWEIQLPVGVQAHVIYPKGYADDEGGRSVALGSGSWMLRLIPDVE